MHKFLPLLLTVIIYTSCKKQISTPAPVPIPNNKALTWINNYGGSNYDFANACVQLPGGEFVIGATTRSTDGDLTGSRTGYDAWLFKTDNSGKIQWSETFGGNDDEYVTGLVSTSDGGLILTGYTFTPSHNSAWAIKTDSKGNKLWQQQILSGYDAIPSAIISTNDGAFLLTGYQTGESQDGWIIKMDNNGNSIWQKYFGGAGSDIISSITKSADGGYVLGGYSTSSDKDLPSNKGNYDGWLMKIDASGNKIWSQTFGGSDEDYIKSIVAAADGGYIAAGYTRSTDKDISLNRGGLDEWLIRIDENGNKQWIKTFGGANEEYVTTIVRTRDGNYITAGYTNSNTWDVYRLNNNFGGWLLKIDGNGNMLATSTYGYDALYDDKVNTLINTSDGGYLLAGYSFVMDKGYDAWLVKIASF